MPSLALLAVVAFFTFIWVRRTRRRRVRWLQQLRLPGVWVAQGEHSHTLELLGELDSGRFRRSSEQHNRRTGTWRLVGSNLQLRFEDDELETYGLTFYDAGKIGLEAAPGKRVYYQKSAANVVPLHRRA